MHSWRVLILPYIDQLDLYHAYKFDEPWDGPNNRKLAERMPRVLALHGEDMAGNTTTNYLTVVGPDTLWQGAKGVTRDAMGEHYGQTILLVESKGAGVHWMEPRDLSFAGMDFKLNNPQGISTRYKDPAIVTADCRVFRLTKDVEPQTLRAMVTITGSKNARHDEERGWHLLPDGRQRPEP